MVPTTAVEIGEGFVVGLERTITKLSGTYRPPPGASTPLSRSKIYLYDDCLLVAPPTTGPLEVHIELMYGQLVVIVWE